MDALHGTIDANKELTLKHIKKDKTTDVQNTV